MVTAAVISRMSSLLAPRAIMLVTAWKNKEDSGLAGTNFRFCLIINHQLSIINNRMAPGEVSEWPKEHAWKACVPINRDRGFESRPLR